MLFTFPSRYLFTIDHKKYLALDHSRPGFLRDFTSPAVLKNNNNKVIIPFTYRAITFYGSSFQRIQLKIIVYDFALSGLGDRNYYLTTP